MTLKARRNTKLASKPSTLKSGGANAVSAQSEVDAVKSARRVATSSIVDTVSGLYQEQAPGRGEFRLDVDGPYPQMAASGVIVSGLTSRLHWIARVRADGLARWTGEIWFREGSEALAPHRSVEISIERDGNGLEARVRFFGAGLSDLVLFYRRNSVYFHPVQFEFDVVEGVTATTAIETWAHPNRPADLPNENLTIQAAFERAGFDVSVSPGSGAVPLSGAGGNQTWSDTEMHDAMQRYWSHFENRAQWSLWVLFAGQHDDGPNLGGVMFDDIGPNHRQGTAIFNNSFIAEAPAGDPQPDAWVARMRFWTACHEMGHAFNLAHSWQKELGASWIPLRNEAEARSFMNYPYNVNGGQTAFFSNFAYRFSEQELLFMRHAPERMVQMGNANWFDDHAFEQAEISPEPKFKVELRVNRDPAVFEFLEPCMLEIKLTNASDDPQVVSEHVLQDSDDMVLVIKKDGQPARQWQPFAQYCRKSRQVVLDSGASRYEAIFIGAGRNGWDVAEPGHYSIQAALRIAGRDFVSNSLQVRLTPPRSFEEQNLAQDFFCDDVGRVLAFDGSRVLNRANAVLQEMADRFPERAVARHALIAVNRPMLKDGKVLAVPAKQAMGMESAAQSGCSIARVAAQPSEAKKAMGAALMKEPAKAAETLGHIDYKFYTDQLSDRIANDGDVKGAAKVQEELFTTLRSRKVAERVLADVNKKRKSYATT